MLNYWISVAFLILLLIPIGLFMLSLVYFTGHEMRNNRVKSPRPYPAKSNQRPQKRALRVVK